MIDWPVDSAWSVKHGDLTVEHLGENYYPNVLMEVDIKDRIIIVCFWDIC